jgi:N-acetylmuramoyl-L-alanine amidase
MKKVAVIIGHCDDNEGALSKAVGTEFDFNTKISEKLTDVADIFFYDSFDKGYTRTIIEDMAPKTKDYKLVLELHFNDFSNHEANGVCALYFHTNRHGKAIGEKYCSLMREEFKSYVRGAIPLKDASQRGFAGIAYQKPTTLILEPFFGNNKEAFKFDDESEQERYANVIKKLISWVNL